MPGTSHDNAAGQPPGRATVLSTAHIRERDRRAWLIEEIGRQYAKVEVEVPRATALFNEMRILPLGGQALSVVRSSALRLSRRAGVDGFLETDAVFFVLVLRGRYRLQQDGRSVELGPGDLTLYDVTRPHVVDCSERLAKIIFKAPGPLVRSRLARVERCTALRIPTARGSAAIAANFLRALPTDAAGLTSADAGAVGACALDLLTLAVRGRAGDTPASSGRRQVALRRLKAVVEARLGDAGLDAARIAAQAGVSVRYANVLLAEEGTSLMRYLWARRLEHAARALSGSPQTRIADVAAAAGFRSTAHFSRAFRARFDCSPRAYAWRPRPRD